MKKRVVVDMQNLTDPKEIVRAVVFNNGDCNRVSCHDCPFYEKQGDNSDLYGCQLILIGAKAMEGYFAYGKD